MIFACVSRMAIWRVFESFAYVQTFEPSDVGSLFSFILCVALFCRCFSTGLIDYESLIYVCGFRLSEFVMCLLAFEL